MSTSPDTQPHPLRRIPYWHLLPFTTYVLLNAIIIYLDFDKLSRIQLYLGPLPLTLMSLATYRVANIIANERVTQIFRAPFVDVKRQDGEEVEVPKEKGVKETIGTLIYCPSCVGVWVATAFVYMFIYFSEVAWVVTAIFALSAMERVLTGLIAWIHKQTD